MTRALACLLLFAAGCTADDLCGGSENPYTCITVKVTGSTDRPFDRLQVDSTYSDGTSTVTHRSIIANTADGGVATSTPVEFPIFFTKAVGIGTAGPGDYPSDYPTLNRGDHGHATVALSPVTKDPNNCFHPITCGGSSGSCPACTLGQACSSYTGSCADSHCGYDTNDNEICMPGLQ